MKKTFRLICFILCLVFSLQTIALADTPKPSLWAAKEVRTAIRNDLVPSSLLEKPYQEPITRAELCALIIAAYSTLVAPIDAEYITNPFYDTDDQNVLKTYSLGIVSGVTDTTFEPDRNVTRQEVAKMFCNTTNIIKGDIMVTDTHNLKSFADNASIAEWAKTYVASLVNEGIIKGDDLGNFNPLGNVTVEQAIIMMVRIAGITDESIPAKQMQIVITNSEASSTGAVNYSIDADNMINLYWNAVEGASEYTVKVVEKRNSRYPDDIAENLPYYYTITQPSIGFEAHNKIKYDITISANGYDIDNIKFTTGYGVTNAERRALVFPFGDFTNYEEAENAMTTIHIPVWQIKDGQKVTATLPLKLNSALANIVSQIFDEIYNDPEQFPIYSIGCYTWREEMSTGRLSEHNYGTAIDINPNENYCLYNDGTKVGSYWKPGEDQHSIDPYGSVIHAFEKYGFTWGGDSWTNPRDYMHFSYLGT